MSGVDLERVASLVVNRCLGVRDGEGILVEGGVHALELLEDMVVAVRKAGGQAVLSVTSDRLMTRTMLEVDLEHLKKPPALYDRLLEGVQARIGVDMLLNPRCLDGVSAQRHAAMETAYSGVVGAHLSGGRMRWVQVGYPTPELAARHGVEWERFERLFWDAVMVDYDLLRERGRRLASLLGGPGRVEVLTGPGHRLELRLEGKGPQVDDGVVTPEDVAGGFAGSNLPCGEVFAPVAVDSVDGEVFLDLATLRGRIIRGITLVYSRGRLVEARAQDGQDALRERLDSLGPGADRLAELGVGTNPHVREPLGYIILDEKLFGSVHVALGDNRVLGGTHAAPSHWDMLALKPTVRTESGLLVENGEFPD